MLHSAPSQSARSSSLIGSKKSGPAPVSSPFNKPIVNPFWGIYAAITRQDAEGKPEGGWHPEQRLSLDETLQGFTSGAAYAAFAEDRLGILKPGYRADLTVIDRDLFQADPAGVLGARVVATVVDGAVAYERKSR